MKRLYWITLALIIGVSISRSPVSAAPACSAFVDVSVFAMIHARSAPHTTVVVEGDRIASVGPASAVKVPRGCERIDGQHRYLIPGLIDTHVHFFGYRRDVEGSPKVEEAILNMLLANGVTTALVMEGSPAILRLREAVANGERIGPRLYVSGPLLQAPHTGELPGRQTFATPAQIQQEIVDEKRRGYDFVKVHGAMPAETYGALLAAAKANHLSVIGHVPDNLGLDAALAGGQVMIAHAESYLQTYFEFERQLPTDPAEIDRMVADVANRTAGAGVFVQPTLSVFRQIIAQVADVQPLLDRPAMKMLPSEATADWQPGRDPYLLHWSFNDIPRFRAEYALMQRLVRGLRDARVPLLIGSDDMVPLQLPGFSVQDEMKQMQEAGLTPYEVLEAATASAGRFFGPNSKVGVIVPGSMADLVLLDANPLLDTANAFRQDGVMLRGRWFTEGELQRRLWASADGGVSVAAIKLVGPAF